MSVNREDALKANLDIIERLMGRIKMKERKPLTPWDVGQVLIDCADELLEGEGDLRKDKHYELANLLSECRLKIGTAFNKLGSHGFSLPETYVPSPDKRFEGMSEFRGESEPLWEKKNDTST